MSTPRRALVVAYCFPPHAAVGTLRTLRLVKQLASDGWRVQVLTGAPTSYPEGTPVDHELLRSVPAGVEIVTAGAVRGLDRLTRMTRPWRVRRATGGVTGSSRPTVVSACSRSKLLALQELLEQLFSIPDGDVGWLLPALSRGIWAGLRTRPDVIYSSAPPWTGQLVAGVLSSVLRCPWVADFRDPWSRGPWRSDRPPFSKRAASFFERLTVKHADALLFTTSALRNEVIGHYGPWLAPKCQVVRNGCDLGEFHGLPRRKPQDVFTLAHIGSLYGARDPVPILRALSSAVEDGAIRRGRFKLRLIGSSSHGGQDLTSICRDLGLNDVVDIVPRITRQESLAAMASADALLLLQPAHPLSVPAKLYEYLAASKPILAIAEGETADIVGQTGTGLVLSAMDERAIREALISLVHRRHNWTAAPPSWFDGRLRGREMVALLDMHICARPRRVGADRSVVGREEM